MAMGQNYAEELAELRRHIAEPVRGILLLEFTTIPQLEGIVSTLRAIDPARACMEICYDPPRENAVLFLARVRDELAEQPSESLPLLVLRPLQLPDASADHSAAVDFWRALNFRRETLGDLPAQILLCVDPWHHDRMLDYAADLRSWTAPKFHLLPSGAGGVEPSESLPALSSFSKFETSPEAAERRWQTFWPELEKARDAHRLEPGHFRRYILPLFESALSQGNLVRARMVRDASRGVPPPEEDIIRWHELNAMLGCAAQDFPSAEDHIRKLLGIVQRPGDEALRQKALRALFESTALLYEFGQYVMAEGLLREQCRCAEELIGADHPNTLASRNNLANVLLAQGKFA